jgi:hypothetical protein
MHHQGDTYLIVPIIGGQQNKSTDKLLPIATAKNAYRLLNVSNYARKLARFKRTISLIVFDGGRESYEKDT